ncbi:hypothetical protein SEA_DARTHPHADER_68 [Mycobacterium phage DarthPhader]|uniref:Gp68-like predicted RNA polymerase component domain-containing protein n=1 Tax=Mycobacterium phage DarthPhader TaxID=1912975 RepID=A0A1I9S414_9CAUD|nr:hypothetical protein KIV60_gp33 [Mycobacterium phage DarthPhader]AOZ61308.1 hypothetical protein SEA_DARTHPHADER_68 [Mycobacterium phage DarthPhader]
MFLRILSLLTTNWSLLMDKHSPDNPRDWNPNHPMLKSAYAPHETAGVLRMQRAGHSGADIMKTLKIKASALTKQFSKAIDAEQAAHNRGQAIYDSVIKSRPRT